MSGTQGKINGVSVIIPTYNGEKLIQEAILSVLNQQVDCPLEVLIIEDGSSDQTLPKIEALNDKRIKVIPTSKNIGTAAARNLGIQQAQYDWIAFNDQDDVWVRDKLQRQITLLLDNTDLDGVVGGYARLANDGKSRWVANLMIKQWSPQHLLPLADPPYYNPAQAGTAYIQTLLVRKSCLTSIEGFRENLPIAYDPDIMLRLGEKFTLGAVDDVVFLYRLDNTSITAPGRLKAIQFLSGFAYCYAAQSARLAGEKEPDIDEFIHQYQAQQSDIDTFTINQAFRAINTQWVNGGLSYAILTSLAVCIKNPVLFIRFALKRVAWWSK